MSDTSPVFWVHHQKDTATLKIKGRANFSNCSPVRVFFKKLLKSGRHHVTVDFQTCTGMDSTFLGVLAELALALRNDEAAGSLVFTHLGKRNLELIENLGLNRLATVSSASDSEDDLTGSQCLKHEQQSLSESKVLVQTAHASLVEADASNKEKFEDLLSLLEKGD